MSKKEIDDLRHTLSLHRALILTKYREPLPIDIDKALEASTETSRMSVKTARGYACNPGSLSSAVQVVTFSKRRCVGIDALPLDQIYEDPTLALIARRNRAARMYAERLSKMDVEIEQYLVGSGLSGIMVMKSDIDANEPPIVQGADVTNGNVHTEAELAEIDKKAKERFDAIEDDAVRTTVIAYLGKHGLSIGNGFDLNKAIDAVEKAAADIKTDMKAEGKDVDEALAETKKPTPAKKAATPRKPATKKPAASKKVQK